MLSARCMAHISRRMMITTAAMSSIGSLSPRLCGYIAQLSVFRGWDFRLC